MQAVLVTDGAGDPPIFDRPLIARFFVRGVPGVQGSKKAFVVQPKAGGRPRAVVVDDSKSTKPWRADVVAAASAAFDGDPTPDAVELHLRFVLPRPLAHYRAGDPRKGLRATAPVHPINRGSKDATKLLRAVEDALKGVVWRDDSQVVYQTNRKVYGERPGVLVIVLAGE